jgi:hypothetical protein
MAGVFHVPAAGPLGPVIESLVLLVECSLDAEWADLVLFLPL